MQHIVKAPVVKVSIGSPGGNRVARILRAGAIVPDGVPESQLQALVDRGLLKQATVAGDEMPAKSAKASDWTDYALAVGVDPTVVKSAKKAQLVAHFYDGEPLPGEIPGGDGGAGAGDDGSGDGSGSGDGDA